MRRFWLNRKHDVSGVSGTGVVVEGVVFANGKCVITWLGKVHSVAVYDSFEEMEEVHGHQGNTEVVWLDHSEVHMQPNSQFLVYNIGKS